MRDKQCVLPGVKSYFIFTRVKNCWNRHLVVPLSKRKYILWACSRSDAIRWPTLSYVTHQNCLDPVLLNIALGHIGEVVGRIRRASQKNITFREITADNNSSRQYRKISSISLFDSAILILRYKYKSKSHSFDIKFCS